MRHKEHDIVDENTLRVRDSGGESNWSTLSEQYLLEDRFSDLCLLHPPCQTSSLRQDGEWTTDGAAVQQSSVRNFNTNGNPRSQNERRIRRARLAKVKESTQHIGGTADDEAGAALSASPVSLADCGLSSSRAVVEPPDYPSAARSHANTTNSDHPPSSPTSSPWVHPFRALCLQMFDMLSSWNFLALVLHGPCVIISSPTLFAATRLHGLDSSGPQLHGTAATNDTFKKTANHTNSICSLHH